MKNNQNISIQILKKLVNEIYFEDLLNDRIITQEQFDDASFRNVNALTQDNFVEVQVELSSGIDTDHTVSEVISDAIYNVVGPYEDLNFTEPLMKLVK